MRIWDKTVENITYSHCEVKCCRIFVEIFFFPVIGMIWGHKYLLSLNGI